MRILAVRVSATTRAAGCVITRRWVRATARRACATFVCTCNRWMMCPCGPSPRTVVREWYAVAMRGSGGRASIMQSYRFLRAVLNTAVRDGAIVRNPCQIPGAGSDRAKERPVASPDEVVALVEAITPRYRAAVLLAAWCGLRRGEVLDLRRPDIDLRAERSRYATTALSCWSHRSRSTPIPRLTLASARVVIPPHVLPVLAEHMASWAGRTGYSSDAMAPRSRKRRPAGIRACSAPGGDTGLPVP